MVFDGSSVDFDEPAFLDTEAEVEAGFLDPEASVLEAEAKEASDLRAWVFVAEDGGLSDAAERT